MNSIKLSILVPVYNVEKYLPRCIESVLSQDFTDYEVILVDDGSPDKSGNICDEYSIKYPNRIKVVHKENGGHNSARLAGFNKASGKYIMFLDSDDYLQPNALTVLYNKIEEGYDIVKGTNNRVYNDDNYIIEKYSYLNKSIEGSQSYLVSLLKYEIPPYLWGGIYKKELFTTDMFDKVSTLSIGEDWVMNLLIWRKVTKYYITEDVVYSYYINPKSIMQSKVMSLSYIKKMFLIIEDALSLNDNETISIIRIAKISAFIKTLFSPEIKWNDSVYFEIINNLSNNYIKKRLKNQIDKKFLLFINNKFIYRVYSYIYKHLYKIIKLKGKKRIIIY